MKHTQLLNDFGWENSRCERSSEYSIELFIQTTNSHFSKVPIRIDDWLSRLNAENIYFINEMLNTMIICSQNDVFEVTQKSETWSHFSASSTYVYMNIYVLPFSFSCEIQWGTLCFLELYTAVGQKSSESDFSRCSICSSFQSGQINGYKRQLKKIIK